MADACTLSQDATRSNLEQQINEIELLKSIYSKPGEFRIEDEEAFLLAEAYVDGVGTNYPKFLSFTVRLTVDIEEDGSCGNAETVVDVCCRNEHTYPSTQLPEVSIRSDYLPRSQQDHFNQSIKDYMKKEMVDSEVCIYTLLEWIKEEISDYCPAPQASSTSKQSTPAASGGVAADGADKRFCRMWLYMHHIYSKIKRRDILSLSKDYQLTGFCLPGKPGVVCVEGTEHNTSEFYGLLRRWNWKSITCRKREIGDDCSQTKENPGIDSLRKFEGFRELSFDVHGPRGNHLDLGQFRQYLADHGLEPVFKDLFGV